MDHGFGHNHMNSNFEFVSPFGGNSLHLEWIAARPSFDTANIWIEVALECKKRFPWAFGWMNSDLNLSDPRIAGSSQDPHTYKQAEINIHRFYLNFCRFVTLFSDSARRIFLKHFSENGFSHWSNSRCGPMLTSMLCNYSYCEMAISPQFQNQFDWPFSRLCGAIKFEQMALLVQQLNVSSDDIFLNLCSGIGHLAFFMSGATPAARLICLETNSRNHAAAWKIKNHFDNWMGWFNKKHNPVELIHGDFLNGQAVFAELFKKATIVLINNESFPLDLDEKIKQNVVNELPIGARIISTRPLTPYVSRDATLHVSLLSTVEEPINRVYAQTRFFLNVKVLNKPIHRSEEQKQLSRSETQSPQPMLMSPEPISMSSEPVTSSIHLPTASPLPLSACSSNTSLADHSIEIPPSIILPVKIPEKDQNPFFPKGSPQRLKRLALEIGDAPEKRQKISSILDKVQQNSLANLLSKLQQHSLEDAKGDIVSFLEQLEPHLAMKETRISELLTALDERKVEIEKLHAEVEDRDRRIEAHQTVIKENINKLQKADREMKMCDNTIRQQSDRYQEIETKLGVLQKELRDREYVIQEMKVVFEIEKNELIEKRIIEESIISSQKYQNLETEMQKLREKNKEQATAIEQKDADFKRLYLRLKKRDELLRSQQKDDVNKDLDLVRLSSTNRGIPDLEKEIKDLKAATSKQKTVIDEKQKEIGDLETRLKTKDDKIRSQMLEIANISHKLQKQETKKISDALEAEIKKKDEKLAEQQVKLMKLQNKEKKTERAVKRENNEDVAALRCEITKLRNMLIEKQNRMMLQESLLKSQETTIEMMKRMAKRGRESKGKNSDDSSNENSC